MEIVEKYLDNIERYIADVIGSCGKEGELDHATIIGKVYEQDNIYLFQGYNPYASLSHSEVLYKDGGSWICVYRREGDYSIEDVVIGKWLEELEELHSRIKHN